MPVSGTAWVTLSRQITGAAISFAVVAVALCEPRGGLHELLQLPSSVPPAMTQTKAARSCGNLLNTRLDEYVIVREAVTEKGEEGAGDWCRATIEVSVPSAPYPITVWLGLPL